MQSQEISQAHTSNQTTPAKYEISTIRNDISNTISTLDQAKTTPNNLSPNSRNEDMDVSNAMSESYATNLSKSICSSSDQKEDDKQTMIISSQPKQ